MAIVISPSSFGGYMSCPYKWMNSSYEADPRNTAHGLLMNCAAAGAISGTDNKLGAFLRYYDNYINPKLEKKKQLSIDALKTGMGNIYKFFKNYITKDYQVFQEVKFETPWDLDGEEDLWISGQPDVIILYNNPSKEDKIVAEVVDIKCGKISWYEKSDIWKENGQWFFYLWLVFTHFGQEIMLSGIDKPLIKFSFAVVDKATGELKLVSKTLDEYTVNIQMRENIKKFRELQKQNLDKKDYPATRCRGCAFCEFVDSCPLKAAEVSVTNEELDQLF